MGVVRPHSSLATALIGLLAAATAYGCTCRGEGALSVRVDGGRAPAAVPLDAGLELDAAREDAGPPPPPDPETELRTAIAALTDLLAGRLPEDIDPQTLFDVDLLDEEARVRRVEVLRASIAARDATSAEAPPEPEVPGLDLDAAIPLDADVDAGEAGADAGIDAGGGTDADAGDLDAGLDAGDLDAGLDASVPAEPTGLEALELERDRLRLRFLTLPAEARTAAAAGVAERRRIAAEEEASRVDAVRATEQARLATEARQDALDRAATSDSAIARELLAERARVESARGELARWEASQARERQELARRAAERLSLTHQLERRLTDPSLPPEEADRGYADVVDALGSARPDLDRALDALGAPSDVPRFIRQLDPAQPHFAGSPERAQLTRAIDELERERERLLESEQRTRWERAEKLADDVRRLDGLRVQLLPKMSDPRRETVLGLGREGRAQLGRELDQIRLMMRFWIGAAVHDLPSLPRTMLVMLERSSTRLELLGSLLLLALVGLLWIRREPLSSWLTGQVHHRKRAQGVSSLVRPFWAVLGPLIVPLVLLICVYSLFSLLRSLTDAIAVDALRVVATGAAWFYVALTATARLFVSRLRHGATRASIARRIFASVRLVLGYGLVVFLVLRLSELLVGRGYLFTIVVDLAWLGAIPLLVFLVHRWGDDIIRTHRERHPEGFCNRQLKKHDSRWRRYLLTAPAAVQLAVAGTTSASKDLALRFEQARRAFAFLFRRRLEKQSEGEVAPFDPTSLPEELRAALSELPCPRALEIDVYPELDEAVERVRAWKDGGPGFALAIVGERGIGKTTWMRALAREAELEAQVITLDEHLGTAQEVCRWLSTVLGVEPADDVDSLAEKIEATGMRHVLLLDHCQNLVLRAIGGTVALSTLVELAARTTDSIVWVCTFSRYTWLYLERARQAQDLFSHIVTLAPWSEEQIVRLIRHRMDAANRHASFQDLVVDRLEGSALTDAVLRTEEEYLRLLWDYADGNPRVALHYWLRSLVANGEELRVRLFAAPDDDELEQLHEQSGFLLAAIVLHENVTESQAAQTCGLTRPTAAALLSFLRQRGFLEEDAGGQWRVTTHWYRAVIRYLRRKRLLFN